MTRRAPVSVTLPALSEPPGASRSPPHRVACAMRQLDEQPTPSTGTASIFLCNPFENGHPSIHFGYTSHKTPALRVSKQHLPGPMSRCSPRPTTRTLRRQRTLLLFTLHPVASPKKRAVREDLVVFFAEHHRQFLDRRRTGRRTV
jgi:hypothetical protein